MLHFAGGSPYPWDGDPNITDGWIADSKWLDTTGSVGTWKPTKGSVNLTQSTAGNKPTYSAAWGSHSKGMLTFDGVDDHLIGDALAAKATGNKPWTIIAAFQFTTLTFTEEVFAFADVSNTKNAHVMQPDSGPAYLRCASEDNGTSLTIGRSDYVCDTSSRIVVTAMFLPSASNSYIIRVNAGVRSVISVNSGGAFGSQVLSKFTVGAYRGASLVSACHMRLRALLFAPTNIAASSYRPAENYLIAEAA